MVRSRSPTLLALAVLVSLLVAACGSPAGASPSATPSAQASAPAPPSTEAPASAAPSEAAADLPTSGRIELPGRGFGLTLADNWFTVDLSEEGIREALDAGLADLPEGFDDQVRNAIGGGISLLAYRIPDASADEGTNLNVIVLPSYGMSLDTIETLNVAQLEQMVGEGRTVESERVTLPSGEAARLTYELAASATAEPVAIEQYFLLGEDNQLVVTCTVPGDGSIEDECRTIAESVDFLP